MKEPTSDAAIVELQELYTKLDERVKKLEETPDPPDPTPEPEPEPDPTIVLDWDLTKAVLQNNQIVLDGVPIFGVLESSYGMGDGSKIQSYNLRKNLKIDPARGVVMAGLLETNHNLPASGAFAGTRDGGAVKFPVPRWFEIEVVASTTQFPQDFMSVWLRHAKGSSFDELDIFETMSAVLGTNKPQFAGHQMGGAAGTNAVRWVYNTDPTQLCTYVLRVWEDGPNMAIHQTVNGDENVKSTPSTANPVYRVDKAKYVAGTDAKNAFDIALQVHLGWEYGADVTKPYAGKLRNGQTGVPANQVPTWAGKSELCVKSIKVRDLG